MDIENTTHQDEAIEICESGNLTHDYVIGLATMVDKRNKNLNELRKEIGVAIYEMERLERNLDLPERGYLRNCFNNVVRTLKEALKENFHD